MINQKSFDAKTHWRDIAFRRDIVIALISDLYNCYEQDKEVLKNLNNMHEKLSELLSKLVLCRNKGKGICKLDEESYALAKETVKWAKEERKRYY